MGRATIWRKPLLRYGAVAVFLVAVHLGSLWFYSAGVYHGPANVPLQAFPDDVDALFVLTFAPTVIGLKYLAYDTAVRAITRNHRTVALRLCFLGGYLSALAYDVLCLITSAKPVADAGFATFGIILHSPLILLAFTGLIAVFALVAGGRRRAGSPRTSVT